MNGMSELPGQSSITNRATWPKPAAAADTRQTERDNLNELITAAEAEHGPLKAEEIQALRDQLHQARREQGRSDTT
jgi:hypothetical protein